MARRTAKPNEEVPAIVLTEDLWNSPRTSKFLGVPEPTLKDWRYRGTGPDWIRVGQHVRYEPEAVRRWLASQVRAKAGAA